MRTPFLLTLAVVIAATVLTFTGTEPWLTAMLEIWPTTDPCGYTPGREGCTKHHLICPVW